MWGRGSAKRAKQEGPPNSEQKLTRNPEASAPQNYNLGGRTSNGNYDKPVPDSINRVAEIVQENKA